MDQLDAVAVEAHARLIGGRMQVKILDSDMYLYRYHAMRAHALASMHYGHAKGYKRQFYTGCAF
jgi:hypothetical protein